MLDWEGRRVHTRIFPVLIYNLSYLSLFVSFRKVKPKKNDPLKRAWGRGRGHG